MLTSMSMMSDANNIAGIASMLYLAIPALTWLILKGSGQMLGNFTGGMSSAFTKNLQSESINKDVSGFEKAKEANKQMKEAGLNKVISFGEAQHFEAKAMGVVSGATLASQMVQGMDSVGDSAYQKAGIDARSASLKKELLGGNGKVVESAAANDAISAKSKAVEQKLIGASVDGKVNMDGANDVATTTGVVGARNTAEAKVQNSVNGIIDNGAVSKDSFNAVTDSAGVKKAASDVGNIIAQNILGNNAAQKMATTEGVDNAGNVAKKEAEQITLNQQDGKGNVNARNVQSVNEAMGNKNAFDITKSREEMELKNVINKDGTVNKENFDLWARSEAGQAYINNKAHMVETNQIQKDMGFKTKEEAENFKAAVTGIEGATTAQTNNLTQQNNSTKDRAAAASTASAQQTKTQLASFKDLKILDEKGNYNPKVGDEYAKTEGAVDAMKQIANNTMFKELKNRTQMSDEDLINHFGGVDGTQAMIDKSAKSVIQGGATKEDLIANQASQVLSEVSKKKAETNSVKQTINKDESTAEQMVSEAMSLKDPGERTEALQFLYQNFQKQGIQSGALTEALIQSQDKQFEAVEREQISIINQNTKEIASIKSTQAKVNEGVKKGMPGINDADLAKLSSKAMSKEEIKTALDPNGTRNLNDGKLQQLANYSQKANDANKKIEFLGGAKESFVPAQKLKDDFRTALINEGSLQITKDGNLKIADTFKDIADSSGESATIQTQNYIKNRQGQKLEYINLKGEEWKGTLDANNKLLTDRVKAERGFSYDGKFNYDGSFAISRLTDGKYDKGMAIAATGVGYAGDVAGAYLGKGVAGAIFNSSGAKTALKSFSKNYFSKGNTSAAGNPYTSGNAGGGTPTLHRVKEEVAKFDKNGNPKTRKDEILSRQTGNNHNSGY